VRLALAFLLIAVAAAFVSCGAGRPPPVKPTSAPLPPVPPPPKQSTSLPWPTYGADNARSRAVTAARLRPPFRRVWTFDGRALLEFPPVVGYGSLVEEGFDGRVHAIDPATGRERWRYYSHRCGWSSPALGDGLVVATFIGDSRCSKLRNGAIVALSPQTGRIRWRRAIGPCESSPLVANGTVYIGDQDGNVYAFAARNGKLRWSFDTGAPIKASPALARGQIFIGNYAGTFYALDARTGKPVWQSRGHGSFYSTAAVGEGRVYVGSLDDHVHAFSARTGAELWSSGTGGYVYASPAAWRGLVLVGSYDDRFYALDGATGAARWTFDARAPISGAASVVDGVVYLSTLAHRTYALRAASGRLLEQWSDGDYSPAVAGYGRLFLVGLGRIYALAPR
jgi:eukaryotic-like serine/threonine-protein kinase